MKTTIFWQKCLLQDPETEKYLVMKRSDYGKDAWLWDLIWGQVHFGEDAKDALRREAQEETWLMLHEVYPLDVHSRLFTEEKWFIFTLRVCDAYTWTIRLSEEHTEYRWVDGDELLQLPMRDTVERVKPVIESFVQE